MARKTYTKEFKIAVVDLYKSGKPKSEIIVEHDLIPATFDRWVKSLIDEDEHIKMLEAKLEELQNENKEIKVRMQQEQVDAAFELYQKSYEVATKPEKRKILNQALKLYPEFIEAEIALIELMPKKEKAIEVLIILEKQLKEQLIADGHYEVGYFWGIIETRPYMRVLKALVLNYTKLEEYGKALEIAEEMLVLCPSDNLGVRYRLLPLYFIIDDVKKVEEFLDEDDDHCLTSLVNRLAFLLAIAEGEFAMDILDLIKELDENSYYYLLGFADLPKKVIKEIVESGYYENGSIEETLVAIDLLPKPLQEVVYNLKKIIKKAY